MKRKRRMRDEKVSCLDKVSKIKDKVGKGDDVEFIVEEEEEDE